MNKQSDPEWWQIFITEYLTNGNNGKKAYLHCHKVKDSTAEVEASKLLRKPKFKKLMDGCVQHLREKETMSREDWLKTLTDVGQRNVTINGATKVKALELHGKSLGYITDKTEVSGDITIVFESAYAEDNSKNKEQVHPKGLPDTGSQES